MSSVGNTGMDGNRFIASARRLAMVLVGLGAVALQLGAEESSRRSRIWAYAYLEKVSEIKTLLEGGGWDNGIVPDEVTLQVSVSLRAFDEVLRQRVKEASARFRAIDQQVRSGRPVTLPPAPEAPPSVHQARLFPSWAFRGDLSRRCGFAVLRGSPDAQFEISELVLPLAVDSVTVRGSDIYFVQMFFECAGGEAYNPPFVLIDARQSLGDWMIFNTSPDNPELRLGHLLRAQLGWPHTSPKWRSSAVQLNATYTTRWPDFHKERFLAISQEAFLPIRFSVLEAHLAELALAEGVRVKYPLKAAEVIRDLMNVRVREPTIFGLTAAAPVAVRLLPIAVFVLAFAIWHRARRIRVLDPVDVEPWLLVRPEGVLERSAAVLWAAAMLLTPVVAAWAAEVFANAQWPSVQAARMFLGAVMREGSVTAGFESLRFAGLVVNWLFVGCVIVTGGSLALLADSLRRIYRLNTNLF